MPVSARDLMAAETDDVLGKAAGRRRFLVRPGAESQEALRGRERQAMAMTRGSPAASPAPQARKRRLTLEALVASPTPQCEPTRGGCRGSPQAEEGQASEKSEVAW